MYTSQGDGKWKLQELTLVFNLSAKVFNLTEGTCTYTLYMFLYHVHVYMYIHVFCVKRVHMLAR